MTDDLFDFPVEVEEPKKTSKTKVIASFGAIFVMLGVLIGVVGAWPSPDASGYGGACDAADGTRGPVIWTVVNKETGYSGSPATIKNVKVTNDFPTTSFKPQPMPNTGNSTATAVTDVPSSFSGTVKLTFTMVWSGTDGSDAKDGSADVLVLKCEPPVTTTTTSTSTSSTTTTAPTTTSTSTTTSTVPTTTSSTTTTTKPTTTTTTKPTTTTSSSTSSTTSSTMSTTSSTSTTTTPPTTGTTVPPTTATTLPSTTITTSPEATTTTVAPIVTGSVSPTPSGSLPRTGANSASGFWIGLALIVLGSTLLYLSIRKKA